MRFAIIEDKLISYRDDNEYLFGIYDIYGNEFLWQKKANQLLGVDSAKVSGPSIIFNEKIFVFLKSSIETNTFKTVCINIQTGDLIREIDGFYGYMQMFNGVIYTLNGNNLLMLNPETFEIKNLNFLEKAFQNDFFSLDSSRWLIIENYLYFVQNVGSIRAKIGVFNIVSREFEAKIDLNESNGVINEIKVYRNKIYVITQENAYTFLKYAKLLFVNVYHSLS